MAGVTDDRTVLGLRSIAKAEGKGERQIRLLLPLAFTPPGMMRDIVADRIRPTGAVELAKNAPVIWLESNGSIAPFQLHIKRTSALDTKQLCGIAFHRLWNIVPKIAAPISQGATESRGS